MRYVYSAWTKSHDDKLTDCVQFYAFHRAIRAIDPTAWQQQVNTKFDHNKTKVILASLRSLLIVGQ